MSFWQFQIFFVFCLTPGFPFPLVRASKPSHSPFNIQTTDSMKFINTFFCFLALFVGIADLAYAAGGDDGQDQEWEKTDHINSSLRRGYRCDRPYASTNKIELMATCNDAIDDAQRSFAWLGQDSWSISLK
jgi:hypothetical protein